MRGFILLLFCFCLCSCCKDDDAGSTPTVQVNAINTYGGSKNDSGQSVVNTTDGGFAVLGHSQSIDGDVTGATDESYEYWLLKFNADAELQWNKTYGGTDDDRGKAIIQTQDNGYAVIGTTSSTDGDVTSNAGMLDFWLAKLDNSGTIQWQNSFGFSGSDTGVSLIQTTDLGYLITGVLDVTASNGQGNSRHAGGDFWAIKLDASGTMQWSKFYGGNFSDSPEGIIQTQDNGYIIVGSSDSDDTDISNNIGSYDFWVIKIDATGTLLWEKNYGGAEIDEAHAIAQAADGNYIIVGDTRSSDNDITTNNGGADLWLIKITPNGDLLWQKTIGGTNFDTARHVSKTQDNGFVIVGSSRSSDNDVSQNKGQNDAWALKVDANGNLLWETTIGGSNIDFGYGITELNNQSIIMVGDTFSNDGDITENKGFTDALIVKIN